MNKTTGSRMSDIDGCRSGLIGPPLWRIGGGRGIAVNDNIAERRQMREVGWQQNQEISAGPQY
jgi:hypothetical protein